MKVALDTQSTVGTPTGIGVYADDLARALTAVGIEVARLRAPWLDPWRFDRRVAWDQALFPFFAARSRADVVHATMGTLPLLRTAPTVVTVHDVAYLRVQGHVRPYARWYFGSFMRRLYRRADAVLTDSRFSRDEFLELVGSHPNVQVVYPGVDARFAQIARRPRAQPFALAVGTVERRKNLLRAVEAVAAIPGLTLVAVGPPTPYLDEVCARIASLGIGERVELRGYVERAQLDELYASATVALVPSTYEGFGYALAEARCSGLPVLAARSSSLVEVAADDAVLLDPADGAAWVDALRALLADRDAAEARAAAGRAAAVARFAWSTAAQQCAAVYRALVDR